MSSKVFGDGGDEYFVTTLFSVFGFVFAFLGGVFPYLWPVASPAFAVIMGLGLGWVLLNWLSKTVVIVFILAGYLLAFWVRLGEKWLQISPLVLVAAALLLGLFFGNRYVTRPRKDDED